VPVLRTTKIELLLMSINLRKKHGHLSPASCRASRKLLEISQAELAEVADISVSTVRRYEAGALSLSEHAANQILAALKKRGIVFVGTARDRR